MNVTDGEQPLTLLVMRHAKSSWKKAGLSDFDRPLNQRGRTAAPLMAEALQGMNLCPELVISSSAQRARQTTELLTATWNQPVDSLYDSSLYLAGPQQYLASLQNHTKGQTSVMVVGHNPGLEYLIEKLTGEDEFMPTAAVAVITCGGSWSRLVRCELREVLRPRELESPLPRKDS